MAEQNTGSVQEDVFRIAVVGGGPKALFAVDSLIRRMRRLEPVQGRIGSAPEHPGRASSVEILLVEANPRLGAGAAYGPAQPEYLRLNVSSTIVDAHEPDAEDRFVLAFQDWAEDKALRGSAAESVLRDGLFPPRAHIGRYFEEAWERVLDARPSFVTIDRVQARVESVLPDVTGWTVVTDDGIHRGPVDEVLLATGHDDDHPGALHHVWRSQIPLVPAVYPVDTMLTEERVAPGSTVAVRGAALTFIDLCLALTEGRGGTFTPDDTGRLRYRRGGREPWAILPVARHGLFLDAKPSCGVVPPEVSRVLVEAETALRAITAASGRGAAVVEQIEATVAQVLVQVTAMIAADAQWVVSYTMRNGAEPGTERLDRSTRALRHSVEVATGATGPGAAWALGRTWAVLYRAVVDTLSFVELAADDWQQFRATAVAMERLAFGPPLVNAQKLLALIDAGIVQTRWMSGGIGFAEDITGLPPDEDPPEVVVDAVLAPPGIAGSAQRLFAELLERGHLSVPEGRRGARITRSGQAVDHDGAPVPGLSVLGRPTEDFVIGHDTLNRRLHETPQLWADRVVERMVQSAARRRTETRTTPQGA